MSQRLAQLVLTAILLVSAMVFVLLDQPNLAVGLVGAVLGQGAALGAQAVVNGKT